MKSLVDIAKEMGFEPNPTLTKADWEYLTDALKTYFLHTDTGLSPDNKSEQKRRQKFNHLPDLIYYTNALQKRGGFEDVVIQNIQALKSQNSPDTFSAPQSIPGDLQTTNFIWHHPKVSEMSEPIERFTADINMGSRIFPDMLKKLDQFARKYHSSFKFPNAHSRHRTDTLNIYMTRDITPDIAQELYGIVKPCLKSTHHDRLNGREIYVNGNSVKGIKIGPVLNGQADFYQARQKQVEDHLARDIQNADLRQYAKDYLKNWVGNEPFYNSTVGAEVPDTQPSLGSVTTSVEMMNLMYYMIGKEGQNPFQLLDHQNKPYQKQLSFTETTEKEKTPMAASFFQRLFHKREAVETPHHTVAPPRYVFDWEDSKHWSDVQTRGTDGIHCGHRINLQHLTEEERKQIRDGLQRRHIQYTERNATTNSADIHAGDLTIRVTDPKSIENLRGLVFNWATGPGTRPIVKSFAEYEAEQQLIRDKRSSSPVKDDTPKWADKKYWDKSSRITAGQLETGYVMDLGDPNDHLHDNPQPFGSGVEIVKALAEKGVEASIGRSMTNGLPACKITHDSVIISGKENVERFEKVFLHQTDVPSRIVPKNNGR